MGANRMKIIKSNKSILLTISNKEIESIVKNVVFANSNFKLIKTAQTTQISEHEIDYLDAWLNALTKKIWAFNDQVNAQKNTAKEFLNKYPEYGKGILPLINALQTNINTTVNNFVEKVNAYDPNPKQEPVAQEEAQPVAVPPTPVKTSPVKEEIAQNTSNFLKSEEGIKYINTIRKMNTEKLEATIVQLDKRLKSKLSEPEASIRKIQYQLAMDLFQKRKKAPLPNKPAIEDMTKAIGQATNTIGQIPNPTDKPLVNTPKPSAVEQAEKYLSNNYLNNKLSIVLSKFKK